MEGLGHQEPSPNAAAMMGYEGWSFSNQTLAM
jgi:hypothetical protein